MKGYFECGKCKHQWMLEGHSMANICPSCGFKGGRCEIGTMAMPDWFREPKPKAPTSRHEKFWISLSNALKGKR